MINKDVRSKYYNDFINMSGVSNVALTTSNISTSVPVDNTTFNNGIGYNDKINKINKINKKNNEKILNIKKTLKLYAVLIAFLATLIILFFFLGKAENPDTSNESRLMSACVQASLTYTVVIVSIISVKDIIKEIKSIIKSDNEDGNNNNNNNNGNSNNINSDNENCCEIITNNNFDD